METSTLRALCPLWLYTEVRPSPAVALPKPPPVHRRGKPVESSQMGAGRTEAGAWTGLVCIREIQAIGVHAPANNFHEKPEKSPEAVDVLPPLTGLYSGEH